MGKFRGRWWKRIGGIRLVSELWLELTYMLFWLTFSGTFPLVVHVKNNMENNGTSIHWHGVRQLGTPEADGPIGVTQCAIAVSILVLYLIYTGVKL